MRQQQYEAYAAFLVALTDEQLVECTASVLELAWRDRLDNDAWQQFGLCEHEAERRGNLDLCVAGRAEANRRRDEARRVNQEKPT